MLRLEAAQWEALRQSVRTRLADTVREELGRQGVAVQPEPSTGELVLPSRSGPPTRLAFAPSGLPTRLTLPSGLHYHLEHDEQGRLAAVVYPHGQRVEYERDNRGNVSKLLRPWHRYALAHDTEDRLVEVRWPDGSHTRLQWHAAGGVACVTDRMGARTCYERTEGGLLQAVVDALGRRTQFETDTQGALQALHFADVSRQEYGWDPEAGVAVVVLRDGGVVRHEVDEVNCSLRATTWADGSRTEYACVGELLHRARNAWGELAFSYGAHGGPLAERTPAGEVACERDEQGRLTRLVAPWGEAFDLEYNEDQRLSAIHGWGRQLVRWRWGPGGAPERVQYGNSLEEERTYARVGRLARSCMRSRSYRWLGEQLYTYDVCERLDSTEDRWGPFPEQRSHRGYAYDAECRLSREVDLATGRPVHTWLRDAKGNLTGENEVAVQVGLMDEPRTWGKESIAYCGNGHMLRLPGPRGELHCTWGGPGLLQQVRLGERTVQCQYDALKRRVWKSDGHTSWRYGWWGYQLLWEEVQHAPGAPWGRRDWLLHPETLEPLAFREQGRVYHVQTDARGAVIRVFDEAGLVVWRARYDAYGVATIEVAQVRQPWRLLGQYEDEETGLYYSLERYYAPWLRAHLSLDPCWARPGATNYSYARHDPLNRVDPLGALAPLLVVGLLGLGAAVGAAVEYALGGDPVAGAVEGATGVGSLFLPGGIFWGGAAAAFLGSLVRQVRKGDELCLECALKDALRGFVVDMALLGLGKIPGVRSAAGWLARQLYRSSLVRWAVRRYIRAATRGKRWVRRIVWQGHFGEQVARHYCRQVLGETLVDSQYKRGAALRGFDFLSYKGTGSKAQLYINEVKLYHGEVPERSFTVFGLGKGGRPVFREALQVARRRINAIPDKATREVLLKQLDNGSAIIRIIQGPATTVPEKTLSSVARATGLAVETLP